MKSLLTSFLILFLSIASGPLSRASVLDEDYSIVSPKGLSSGTCYTTIRDRNGFIWTSTRNGIDRYDGAHFRHYRLNGNSRRELHDGMMIYLYLDDQGRIWVYTERSGLYRYNPDSDTFEQAIIFPPEHQVGSISGIYVHGDEVIIGVTNGLMTYDMSNNGERVCHLLPNYSVRCFAPYKDGILLVGTNKGLAQYDLRSHRATTLYDRFFAEIRSIYYEAANQVIWVGTNGHGLYRINEADNGRATLIGDPHMVVYCICPADDDEYLIGTDGDGLQLVQCTEQGAEMCQLASDAEKAIYPIHCSCVRNVMYDKGRIWLSMHYGGIALLQPAYGCTQLFNTKPRFASDYYAFGVNFDQQGRIWVAFNEAIACYDSNGNCEGHYLDHQARFLAVQTMSDGTVWCGGYNTGLYHFDPVSGRQEFFSSVHGASTNDCVYAFHVDKRGDLWVGGLNFGMTRIHQSPTRQIGDGIESLTFDHTGISMVTAIAQLTDSVLAVSTCDGLYLYNIYTHHQQHIFEVRDDAPWQGTNYFASIAVRHGHEIWLATDGAGLLFYDTATDNFESYGYEYGLPSLELRGLTMVNDSIMCVSSEQGGIFSFNCSTHRFLHSVYTNSAELQNAFQQNSIATDGQGLVVAGGDHCAILIDGKNLQLQQRGAQIHVDGTSIIDNHIFLPNNSRDLSLSFITTDIEHQSEYHFMYRVIGLDKDWIHMSESRSLEYHKMPPGHYTLEVVAVGAAGYYVSRNIEIDVERNILDAVLWISIVALVIAALLHLHYHRSKTRNP